MAKNHKKNYHDFSSEHEVKKFCEKQNEAWKHLIRGDNPYDEKCGEPWDKWNTTIAPQKRASWAYKLARKIKKIIDKNDKNGDGKLDACDYNCAK